MTSHVTASKASDFSMKYGIARVALLLTSQSGRDYIFATELPAGPRAALGIDRSAIVLQWGVALLVSGLICSLLTRYLTDSDSAAPGNVTKACRRRSERPGRSGTCTAPATRLGTSFAISMQWLRESKNSSRGSVSSLPMSRTSCDRRWRD